MIKQFAALVFGLALLLSGALAVAQSSSDQDLSQTATDAAVDQEQETLANDASEQDSTGQDVAQVEDEEESSGRFIPTEQLSQDLGASFPVDI